MTPFGVWTGREACALRAALRQSQRGFAAHLGVNKNTVFKWEARKQDITPSPELQDALDTALRLAPAEVRDRFMLILDSATTPKRAAGEHEVTASTFALSSTGS